MKQLYASRCVYNIELYSCTGTGWWPLCFTSIRLVGSDPFSDKMPHSWHGRHIGPNKNGRRELKTEKFSSKLSKPQNTESSWFESLVVSPAARHLFVTNGAAQNNTWLLVPLYKNDLLNIIQSCLRTSVHHSENKVA